MMLMMLRRKHKYVRQCPHGIANPRPAVIVEIQEEQLVVVASERNTRVQGSLSKCQFLDAEHVVLPDRNRRLPLDLILNAPGWQRRTGAQVSQFAGMLATCSQSDMIATVPERLARQYAPAMDLQILPFPVRLPPIPVYMIWSPSLDKDPAHQWLRLKLVENVTGAETESFSRV